jgi:hypothetical protein
MKEKYKILILLGVIFITVFVYTKIRDKHRFDSMKKSKLTYGVVNYFGNKAKGPSKINLFYKNNLNKKVIASYYGSNNDCDNNIDKGDTVLIKYSVIDNSVIEIINCYWNEALRKMVEEQDK